MISEVMFVNIVFYYYQLVILHSFIIIIVASFNCFFY